MNCIQEGLIPKKYYEKSLSTANNAKMKIQYKLSKAHICNKGICFKNVFILVKYLNEPAILGTPFLQQIMPFNLK